MLERERERVCVCVCDLHKASDMAEAKLMQVSFMHGSLCVCVCVHECEYPGVTFSFLF